MRPDDEAARLDERLRSGVAQPNEYPDHARRASDTVRLHILAGSAGKWCALALYDGSSDNHVYDTCRDAKHAMRNSPKVHAFCLIPADDFSPRHAYNFLKLNRQAHEAEGIQMADPEAPAIRNSLILPNERVPGGGSLYIPNRADRRRNRRPGHGRYNV